MGGRSSSRTVFDFGPGVSPPSVAGVDSADLEGKAIDVLMEDHFTGIGFFRLSLVSTTYYTNKLQASVQGSRPDASSATSCPKEPPNINGGVSDGSQKSGGLLFDASVCSRSACRSAISWGLRVSLSYTRVEVRLAFVPCATSQDPAYRVKRRKER